MIFGPKMAQNSLKKDQKEGQKLVFFIYSHIIYFWKAYGKEITTFVNLFENFHFLAQNGTK